MAGSFMVGGDAGGNGRRVRYPPMSDINVTPMVDVMLVLLVIFMVTAPLLTVGVPVDLPQTKAPAITEPKEPLVITVDQAGQDLSAERSARQRRPARRPSSPPSPRTIPTPRSMCAATAPINYGRILEVMGLVGQAGFTKVSLIAELPRDTKSKR